MTLLKTLTIGLMASALTMGAAVISANATETGAERTPYAMKKMGRVQVQQTTEDTASAVSETETTTEYANPADIEPAAGDIEPTMDEDFQSLSAQQMKLPRK